MAALVDVLKHQMEQGESPEGAGGVRKLKMTKKVKGFGAVLSETAAAAEESRLERQEQELFNSAQALATQLDDGGLDGGGSFGDTALTAALQASLAETSTILPKGELRGKLPLTADGPQGLSSMSDPMGPGKTMGSLPGSGPKNSQSILSATAIHSLIGRSHTESPLPSTSSRFYDSSMLDSAEPEGDLDTSTKKSENVNVRFRKLRSNKPTCSLMGVPSRLDPTKMVGPIV